MSTLPSTHKALVLTTTGEPICRMEMLPVPQPSLGSVVVRVLAAGIVSYVREILEGTRQYPLARPSVPGVGAICRVAAIGSDTTVFTLGQLVYADIVTRPRDDPSSMFILGVHAGFTEGTTKLAFGEWKDATYGEYAKIPLENCHLLDEAKLLKSIEQGGFGYKEEDLAYISKLVVPFGGLRDIDLKAGETIIIAPATGSFGRAAVHVALAMGATVIAMGRNKQALQRLAGLGPRVKTVPITGNSEDDLAALKKQGTIDAYLDISPPSATDSTHLKSGILAVRDKGRISLMGGIIGDVAIPHGDIMWRSKSLHGKLMYEREDIVTLIKMIETGVLPLGEGGGITIARTFTLEDWEEAFVCARDHNKVGGEAIFRMQ
jgi:NADPH:quinone reductase-like Zn-dependent oxidoreductase